MMAITDPFFAARTPISIRPWPLPPLIAPAEPLRPHQRLFPHSDQPVPGCAGRSAQFLLPRVRQRHPGCPTRRIGRVLAAAAVGLRPAGDDLDPGVPGRVLRLLELRAAMAALDDGLLYLTLAVALDALPACGERRPNRQPRPAHLRRTSAASSTARAAAAPTSERRHLQLHHLRQWRPRPTWSRSRSSFGASRTRMDAPIFGVRIPGFLFWVAVIYACFATGMTQLHRPIAVAALFPTAGGRGELPLRPRAHPRIQRADRAAQRRGSRDRPRRTRVQRRIHHRSADHPGQRRSWMIASPVLLPDLGHHSLCRDRALLFRGEA